ncbi:hypothetical protein HK100_010969, partial [Physocladia obscura]
MVEAIADGVPGLVEVSLTGCLAVTDVGVLGLRQRCKGLKVLRVVGCLRVVIGGGN